MSEEWRVKTNAEYKKIVATVMNLATASLVLPIIFLKDITGLKENQPLWQHLKWQAFVAWICLGLAVFFGLTFSYASAKFVKAIYSPEGSSLKTFFEQARDISAMGLGVFFSAGLVFLLWFFFVLAQ